MSQESRWRPRVPPLPKQAPASRNGVTRRIGYWFLAVAGWGIDGQVPPIPKFVAIVAPHTSNWDFVIGLAMNWAMTIDAKWIGKHTLFRWPFGLFMRAFGGIPVNRDAPQGIVHRVAQIFRERDQFVLGLAPEGTRRGAQWKSGFWRIAREAGVPIVPVSIDYRTRRLHIGPPMMPSDDYDRDLAAFQSFFAPVRGARPERYVAPGD